MTTPPPGGLGRIGASTVARIGYGAMAHGEPPSAETAISVLRRAIDLGVNHIDTASFYLGGEVNRRIRRALSPYPDDLVIVSKVGAEHVPGAAITVRPAQRPLELRAAVEADLDQLGLDQIDVVNLRRPDNGPGLNVSGDQEVDIDDQLAEMITLRDEGKIGAIGLSNVSLTNLQRAKSADIACVQNAYSLLDRTDERILKHCIASDIAWVPYFPLGSPFPNARRLSADVTVAAVAGELSATITQIALAWLLAHTPNSLLIPGTRSVDHLEQNIGAGAVTLDPQTLVRLDAIQATGGVTD